MIFNMKLQPQPFEAIKSGRKDIEMRLYDEKRKQIKKKDLIEFTSLESGEKILCKVVNLHIFSSFKQLYAHFDKKRLGYHENETAKPSDMEKYYPKSEQAQFGVIGIEIKLTKLNLK